MTSSSVARVALPLVLATLVLILPTRAQDKGASPGDVATPGPVIATQIGPGEITVTWTEVPGATGYNVGRSVFPNGYQRLCPRCPASPTYVDRSVSAGVRHSYRVVVLLAGGKVSRPAVSEPVTPQEDGAGSRPAGTEPGANELAAPGGDTASNLRVTRPVTRDTPLDPIVEVEAPRGCERVATLRADSASSCGGSAGSGGDTTSLPVRRPALGAVRADRDERFGYWAPAPMAGAAHAQRVFGLSFAPRTEQCFGGLGPACAGTVPFMGVEPKWFGFFELPNGTQMGYVSVGVAVGSILHDNACLRDRSGLNCSGLGAGDLIKTGLWPASLEWNKAAWNLIDKRTWREVFGPYPTSTELRLDEWYDDLRVVRNRPAMMAEAISMIAFPGLTVVYRGGETRQSRALKAPPGTSLDETDAAFCASGKAGERQLAPVKASWVLCQ